MNPEASQELSGQPFTSMVPNGQQASWQIPVDTINNPLRIYRQSQDPSIDPQLRSERTTPAASVPAFQPHLPTNGPDIQQSIESQDSSTGAQGLAAPEALTQRQLPSQDVTDETFDDTYVAFILYCNPSIPLNTDTTELRKAFRNPPKSDGKNFNPFTLFKLIGKLELREIKTWAQLAIDLGVEPPAVDKGQSAQKVQQYAVRLKRWMHAMHVDAFFEYLLHKSHAYWTQIPSVADTPSEFGRDGVAPEEDLALRALIPETRPKRGRRKAEDKENEVDFVRSPPQKPRLHSPTPSDDFTIGRTPVLSTPASARPDFAMNSSQRGPWPPADARLAYGVQGTGNSNYIAVQSPSVQWRPKDPDQTPFTPHPHSAITPRTNNPFLPYEDEPRSAITPSKSRTRRRHGPAVSSAWPSSSTAAGKLRGRPPSNRTISDGPFSTFPANPNAKTGPTINLRDTPVATPVVESSAQSFVFPQSLPPNNRQATKPSGLHLQVPERKGGEVRLATPPPTVLVNGESEAEEAASDTPNPERETTPITDCLNGGKTYTHFDHNTVSATEDRLSQKTEPSSRSHQLANSFFHNEFGEDHTNVDVVDLQLVHTVLRANWYNTDGQPTERCSIDEAYKIVRQIIYNLRDDSCSKERFVMNLTAIASGESLGMLLKITKLEGNKVANSYRANWIMRYGSVEGGFDLKIKVPRKPGSRTQEPAGGDTEAEIGEGHTAEYWHDKYVELQARIRERDQKAKHLRNSVLDALLAATQDHES